VQRLRFLNCFDQRDLFEIKSYLTQHGFFIFEIDGSTITDATTFYDTARKVLPSDPPFGPIVSWDGFVDSFFGGLNELKEPKVAVIWTHVEKMLLGSLRDLLDITNCLNDVAVQVISPSTGVSVPVSLVLFLVGEGENFPAFA
jgi:hypothetical protein